MEVQQLIALTKNKLPGQELQPKEVIATNAQIREHMRQLNEDYKELERLYQKEKNKRRVSKTFSNRIFPADHSPNYFFPFLLHRANLVLKNWMCADKW